MFSQEWAAQSAKQGIVMAHPEQKAVGGALADPVFRSRIGRGLFLIGGCVVANRLMTPMVPWWILVMITVGFSLCFDYLDALGRVRQAAEAAEAVTPEAVRRLRGAVEDLMSRLTPAQSELLGDVAAPVATLEARVQALVRQGAEVDAELRLHDFRRIERDVQASRKRMAALSDDVARQEEQLTLKALEQQLATLGRVKARRERIDARLRAAVANLQALHLDLVELVSTDLEFANSAIEQFGAQVRDVSRGVEALASALDETTALEMPLGARSERASDSKSSRRRERS